MLASALVLRVALGSFIDASGFDTDLMQSWTRTLLNAPLSEIYAVAEGPDHLPGDLWFLWAIGHGLELFGFDNAPRGPFVALMKLVPAVADVVIAWELFALVRPFATSRAALIVAGAFAFNPGAIFLTSVWGQWDSLSMAMLLGGLLVILKTAPSSVGDAWNGALLHGRHPERSVSAVTHSSRRHPDRSEGSQQRIALGGVAGARRDASVLVSPTAGLQAYGGSDPAGSADPSSLRSFGVTGWGGNWRQGQARRLRAVRAVPLWPVAVPLLTWAVLIKPPLALVAGLLVLYACVRTFLEAPTVGGAIGRTAIAIVLATVLGIATALLIILPFGVGLPGMATRWSVLERARYALDLYPFTTLQAANIWMIKDAHLYRPSDLDGTLLGLSERAWGSLLLATALAWIAGVVVRQWRRAPETTLALWAALATSYAIFMLPTRVHERYFFPVMVLALALAGLEAGRQTGHHRGVPYDDISPDEARGSGGSWGADRWAWRLAVAISGLFLVSLLIAYTPTVNAIRAALFDVPLSFLFRTLAIVNFGVFVLTMTLPLWQGRRPWINL